MNIETYYSKSQSLEEDIRKLQEFTKRCPEGTLVSRKNADGTYSYSQSLKNADGKRVELYLGKGETPTAKGLAAKGYSLARLKDLKREKRIIDSNISLVKNEREADHYLRMHPGAASLMVPVLTQKTPFSEEWMKYPYIRSKVRPADLIYPSVVPGLMVRSKAEADILERFVFHGVPFHYEEEHIFNGIPYHPDFTCLNEATNQIIFWEHLGRLDDPKYSNRIRGHSYDYLKAGIIPWKNLIFTTETENLPLDIKWVDTLIQFYLK